MEQGSGHTEVGDWSTQVIDQRTSDAQVIWPHPQEVQQAGGATGGGGGGGVVAFCVPIAMFLIVPDLPAQR
jgi:hypothetical protein